ncbi:UNVERIFIED_CONTAM: GNAT family N-acetyltransferase [Kocuria sp. CPCC 205316]|uniref:GNAT family N-acetyltransferase n=1 Tax=Kocuria sp. CPCC 205316 TaxID=3073559 RepID=UPI0036D91DE7
MSTAPAAVHLRTAGPSDVEVWSALHLRCLDETYRPLFGDAFAGRQQAAADRTAGYDRTLLADPDVRTLLAVDDDGTPLGLVSAGPAPAAWEGRAGVPAPLVPLQLFQLYVLGAAHGTGVGAALQEAAIGSADAYLWIMDGNARAERFYARHGFRALAESFPAGGPWAGQHMHRMLRTGTA